MAAEQVTQHCADGIWLPDCELVPQQCSGSIKCAAPDCIELDESRPSMAATAFELCEMVSGARAVVSDEQARASMPDKSVIKVTATANSVAPKMRRPTPGSLDCMLLDLPHMAQQLIGTGSYYNG